MIRSFIIPRWLKLLLKGGGIVLGLIFILWMAVAAYVYSNKAELLKSISDQLNENLKGSLSIERMEPSLIRGFPGISVSLENVLLRDSLWEENRHDLLRAENVYVAVNAFSILSGSPVIRDIRVSGGAVYLFTDSAGHKNTDILKKKVSQDSTNKGRSRINRIIFDQVELVVDDQQKNKLFKFDIDRFAGTIRYNSLGWKGNVRLKTMVRSFAFNLEKGSFLKDHELTMNLDLSYDDQTQLLSLPEQDIRIGKERFTIGGQFSFSEGSSDFQLNISAPSIVLKDASALLTPRIASRLKAYEIKKPIRVQAAIGGHLKGGGEPLIDVSWEVNDNTLIALGETVTGSSFTGSFSNEWIKGAGRNDTNSVIRFNAMRGKYHDIPFTADSIRITDLKKPVFTGRFRSSFAMNKLNPVIGSDVFAFESGNADLDMMYKAPYNADDKGERFIYGHIQVKDAGALYKPRNLALQDMSMVMEFGGTDLFIRDLKLRSGTSSLAMEGQLRNFSNLYYSDPQKMLIDWEVNSKQLNLNEFMSFATQRRTTASAGKKSLAARLDRMLEQASMKLNVKVDRLVYKKFAASGVQAAITLRQSGITIENLSLRQGGGSVRLTGGIDYSGNGSTNSFNVNSKISNVNVEQLFYAFENFGQDAIESRNLRGAFSGGTAISGAMKNDGTIVPGSFRGTVEFDLRNGALVNFEPMVRLGKFAFANRDFSDIRFTNLKNKFNIQGNKVIIPPMEIRSSVLNVFLEGVYSFSTGTDIAIQIPLRNPERDAEVSDRRERRARERRGIVLNLNATDGDDGQVKFRLGKRSRED